MRRHLSKRNTYRAFRTKLRKKKRRKEGKRKNVFEEKEKSFRRT